MYFEGTRYADELGVWEKQALRMTLRFLTEQLKGWSCWWGDDYHVTVGLGVSFWVLTKNAKISMANHIGSFLARGSHPMWVCWKIFAITKEALLMEAPCLEGSPFGQNTEHFQLPQQERERLESPKCFSLTRLEVIHGTSAHIKMVTTSQVALPCVVVDVP